MKRTIDLALGSALLAAAVFAPLSLIASSSANAQTATEILPDGAAAVAGFSGAQIVEVSPGRNRADAMTIDLAGPAARIIMLDPTGGPPQTQVIPAPKPFTVTAGQIGQVFAVAVDDAVPPNIFVAATSAYGLPIIVADASGALARVRQGMPGAAFMPGLFGPPEAGGSPGSIWQIDGVTGETRLFANVTLDGMRNTGPALGALAFDPASGLLFVSDRETGMIHGFDRTGVERTRFDHGVTGRVAAGLPPVAFDPAMRLDITSPQFQTDDPMTWGYAAPERLIYGLAVRASRLYYAVAAGSQIWSVGIAREGTIAADARIEIEVAPGSGAGEIAKILFDDQGRMLLAERPAPTGAYDFGALSLEGIGSVLRYAPVRLASADDSVTWRIDPDEYAIGFAAELRNTNGGIAVGYDYDSQGRLDRTTCGGFLWTTGEQLRHSPDPAIAMQLAQSGPLPLNGLQGNRIDLVRPQNVPPFETYFAGYRDDAADAAARGHLGDMVIRRSCQTAAAPLPVLTAVAWWPTGPSLVCPPGFVRRNGICREPPGFCPPHVTCCPQGTAPGADGQCGRHLITNRTCPVGAVEVRHKDGGVICLWQARCPDGQQPGTNGRCEQFCPHGYVAWRNPDCKPQECTPEQRRAGLCGHDCTPEQIRLGQCGRPECPAPSRWSGSKCCSPQDMMLGRCGGQCPRGNLTMDNGRCCTPEQVRAGQCGPKPQCPDGGVRLSNGECCPGDLYRAGRCGTYSTPLQPKIDRAVSLPPRHINKHRPTTKEVRKHGSGQARVRYAHPPRIEGYIERSSGMRLRPMVVRRSGFGAIHLGGGGSFGGGGNFGGGSLGRKY